MVMIEGDGPIVRRKRRIKPIGQSEHLGLHVMRMGIVRRGGDGPRGGFVGPGQHLGRFGIPTVAVDEREDFLPFVNLNLSHFSPHLHDRLTTNPAGIIARTMTQHGHQDTQESVANVA
jgi:hypothetical protein